MRFGERPPSNKDSVGKKLLKVGAAVTSGLAIYNGVAGEPIQDTIKRGLGWERRTFQMDTRDVTMFKESRWNEIKKKKFMHDTALSVLQAELGYMEGHRIVGHNKADRAKSPERGLKECTEFMDEKLVLEAILAGKATEAIDTNQNNVVFMVMHPDVRNGQPVTTRCCFRLIRERLKSNLNIRKMMRRRIDKKYARSE